MVLGDYASGHPVKHLEQGYDEAAAESFPASDAPAYHGSNGSEPREEYALPPAEGRPSSPTPVTLADGTSFEIDHEQTAARRAAPISRARAGEIQSARVRVAGQIRHGRRPGQAGVA